MNPDNWFVLEKIERKVYLDTYPFSLIASRVDSELANYAFPVTEAWLLESCIYSCIYLVLSMTSCPVKPMKGVKEDETDGKPV